MAVFDELVLKVEVGCCVCTVVVAVVATVAVAVFLAAAIVVVEAVVVAVVVAIGAAALVCVLVVDLAEPATTLAAVGFGAALGVGLLGPLEVGVGSVGVGVGMVAGGLLVELED